MRNMTRRPARLALGAAAVVLAFTALGTAQKPDPELKGSKPYQITEDKESKAWKEDRLLGIGNGKKWKTDEPDEKSAKISARTRGDQVYNCGGRAFKGKCTMYGFTNHDLTNDAYLRDRACGPAAIATAVWEAGGYTTQGTYNYNAAAFAKDVMRVSPPKITLGGWLPVSSHVGTDWRQFNYGLDKWAKHGIKYAWVKGEAEVQNQVAAGRVVAVMIDLGALPRGRYAMQDGAHWVVIYGYDDVNYYVTNFTGNVLKRSDLRDSWGMSPHPHVGVYAKGHGTAGMGVVVYK